MRRTTTTTTTPETPTPAAPAAELIPLAHLVIEGLAENIDALAAQLDEVFFDDIGRRCTTRDTARRLFAERADVEERQRAAERRTQERLQRQQEELLATIRPGVPAPEGLQDLSALEVMLAGAHDERLEESGRRFDEMASGGLTFHPIEDKDYS